MRRIAVVVAGAVTIVTVFTVAAFNRHAGD